MIPLNTIQGTFVRRYKRFFVDVNIDGNIVQCYTNNTGKMVGLLLDNAPCLLIDQWKQGSKGKFQYKWVAVQIDGVWIGTDTHMPNTIIKNILPELYPNIPFIAEKKLGNSRLDFVSDQYAIEVKNVHWSIDGVGNFPDCVTARGYKHVENLMNLDRKPVLIYVVQRFDVDKCTTNQEKDPNLKSIVDKFIESGGIMRGIKVKWTENGITEWQEIPYVS